jgi:hypothetical protein
MHIFIRYFIAAQKSQPFCCSRLPRKLSSFSRYFINVGIIIYDEISQKIFKQSVHNTQPFCREPTMLLSRAHLENNHRKINTLEKIAILQTSPLISDLNSKINSPGQATKEISRPNNQNNNDLNFNCQLPKPGDRKNALSFFNKFHYHKKRLY